MGNNAGSKMYAAGVAGSVVLGGALLFLVKKDGKAGEGVGMGHAPGEIHVSPVVSPVSGKIREFTPQQMTFIEKMEQHFLQQNTGQGKYLQAQFFDDLQEVLYLRSKSKVEEVKREELPKVVVAYNNKNTKVYQKIIEELAEKITEIEEDETDRIVDVFNGPMFIQASKIHLLRHDCEDILKSMAEGSKLKQADSDKDIDAKVIGPAIAFLKKKMANRIIQGFADVHKEYFPAVFKLEMECELLSEFNLNLDEFWSFCSKSLPEANRQAWDGMMREYIELLKSFYHSMTLFAPCASVL